jgi:hypothetical protein
VINAASHEDSIWALHEECIRWCFYETNLLGDPHTILRGQYQDAKLVYKSCAIQDSAGNSGGLINPGETVNLIVTLQNIGLKNTTGVSATISTTDSYVTSIIDNSALFGDIQGAGATKQAQDPYTIKVDQSCPTPHEIVLTLNITGTQTTANWSDTFKVMVYTSSQISGIVKLNGAGLADANENIQAHYPARPSQNRMELIYSAELTDPIISRSAKQIIWIRMRKRSRSRRARVVLILTSRPSTSRGP